jgi:hypothetical protein
MDNKSTAPGRLRIDEKGGRDILVVQFELEREDIMKFKPLYEATHIFLTTDEGYKHPDSGDEKVEELYWERWTPSGAKEQHLWWRASKTLTPFMRSFIVINWQTLNVTKAEVAFKNKKVNAEKIDLIMRVWIYLQWDPEDKFKNSLVWQFRKMFFNKLYVEEMEQKKKELGEFGVRLQRLIRTYFEMVVDGDYPAMMFPPMGYKEQ